MKTLLFALPLALLSLSTCTSETASEKSASLPSGGLLSAQGTASIKKSTVPFKGTFNTISRPLGPPLTNPARQPQGISGEGRASHLGNARFEATSVILFAPTPPFTNSGTSTMTAANGDQLYSTFTGTILPQPNGLRLVRVRHLIRGGTGRFADASGYYTGVTVADPSTPAGVLDIEGEISY